jgi:nucleotide-binding universal stress UspA family protein
MIRTILVSASGDADDPATLAAALTVARSCGAHLDVLHVRVDPVNTTVAMTTDGGSGALSAGLIDQLERDAREREAKAREGFLRFCREAGIAPSGEASTGTAAEVSAEWHVEIGDEGRWMTSYGRTADLIVASRSTSEDSVARSTLEAALLETGRPVLIPAGKALPARFERVAVAWKSSPEAARAVALAMPLIGDAKEVVVVTVEEQPSEHDDTDRLVRNFARHGLAASAKRLAAGANGVSATVLAEIGGQADLLVMGGYGHSQLREWIFGGFTQDILDSAPVPVLIAH